MDEVESLRARLIADGVISDPRALFTPLTGGVSSEIYRIDPSNGPTLVVKRALAKLRTRDAWLADVGRNDIEQGFVRYVGAFAPHSVPRLVYGSSEHHYLVMEWLDSACFANWKQLLLSGRIEGEHARRAGTLLGTIHRHAWQNDAARRAFETGANFHALRIEPYLLTTGQRHPSLREAFEHEACRLASTHETLVHGDFSPKNMLVSGDRLVILDCEVAWFGDGAFDLAFLLNHLLLKACVATSSDRRSLYVCAHAALKAYGQAMDDAGRTAVITSRLPTLLPMLMLARIDGKSPVEYLTDATIRDSVRTFAAEAISRPHVSFDDLLNAFTQPFPVSPEAVTT